MKSCILLTQRTDTCNVPLRINIDCLLQVKLRVCLRDVSSLCVCAVETEFLNIILKSFSYQGIYKTGLFL